MQKPKLVQFLHSEYPALFPDAETRSEEMLKNSGGELSQHPELLG